MTPGHGSPGVDVPAASVITSKDTSVDPQRQHELATAIGAAVFEVPLDHLEMTVSADEYNPALLQAVAAVASAEQPEPAGAIG